MTKSQPVPGKSTLARSRKTGAVVKSAESRRMGRLSNIPTVERRDAAVKRLLGRAK